MRELNPCPLLPESRIYTIKPTAHKRSLPLLWFRTRLVGRSLAELFCQLNIKPPWPNGQGAPLLRVRLWVRVPPGVNLDVLFSDGILIYILQSMGNRWLFFSNFGNVKYRCHNQLYFNKLSWEKKKEFSKIQYCAHESDILRKKRASMGVISGSWGKMGYK